MNMSTSECTSGCESGWTMYLDQSVNSGYDEKCEKGGHSNGKWPYVSMERDEAEDEDDLSMVSDASSGPKQKFDEEEENKYGFDYGSQTTKARSKVRLNEKKRCNDVDDTASSTFFTCVSKTKSGSLKKGSSVAKNGVSNKSGEMRKGCDFAAQGSRELGSARKN